MALKYCVESVCVELVCRGGRDRGVYRFDVTLCGTVRGSRQGHFALQGHLAVSPGRVGLGTTSISWPGAANHPTSAAEKVQCGVSSGWGDEAYARNEETVGDFRLRHPGSWPRCFSLL
jgi:hypothetical protein